MINSLNKNQCCGCSSCVQICPKKCITMKTDEEGFQYPVVNTDLCINCGFCEKSCPILNDKKEDNDLLNCYVAYTKDNNIRLKSSSGGIFSILAENILNKDGVIFGAAFDKEFLVHHISVDNLNDLYKLRGSKYIQSRIEGTFQETKQLLEEGRCVLYSGTACQIAGLKKYLNKEYENLYTIGVLCHGAPSPKVWERYKEYRLKQSNSLINEINFRDKKTGWKGYSIKFKFNNNIYEELHNCDIFMKLFLSDICLRPSCHDCKFKDLNRPADITLGDCWGIENYMPDMDDDKGTSVILVHSKKGQALFNEVNNKIVYRNAEIDKALPPHADSRKSVGMHPNRNIFFKKLNQDEDIDKLVKLVDDGVYKKVKLFIKKILRKIKACIKKLAISN